MPDDLDEELELINLVPIESEFAIIDQKTVIQNVDKNQGNIPCEICDQFVKMEVPCKISNNKIIYIPVEEKKDKSSDKSGMAYTKSEKLRKRRNIDKIAKQKKRTTN